MQDFHYQQENVMLARVKPEGTLVEARSDSDMQIDCQIWV